MNVLDLGVLLLVSNALQNAMIGPDNSLIDGIVGAATLFAVNYAFVRLVFNSRRASRILEGTPTVLLEHGHVLHRALRSEAITVDQLRAEALERGFAHLIEAALIVLQPNGHMAIMAPETARAWREREGG